MRLVADLLTTHSLRNCIDVVVLWINQLTTTADDNNHCSIEKTTVTTAPLSEDKVIAVH